MKRRTATTTTTTATATAATTTTNGTKCPFSASSRTWKRLHARRGEGLTVTWEGSTIAGSMVNFTDGEMEELWEEISVSAGQRGIQLFVHPADYLRAVQATTGEIARF